MSRNKREGMYVGNWYGKHVRSKSIIWNRYVMTRSNGMVKYEKFPSRLSAGKTLNDRRAIVWNSYMGN